MRSKRPMRPRQSKRLVAAHSCLAFALRKAARKITRVYDAALRPTGLRLTQFNVLGVLDAMGPVGTVALAEQLAIERTTLTRNLAVLARLGWVKIVAGEDRRWRNASITVKGQAAALRAFPAWQRADRAMRERLGSKRSKFVADLSRLLAPGSRNSTRP